MAAPEAIRRRRSAAAITLLVCASLVYVATARAVEVEGLYTVEVTLDRRADSPEERAYEDALKVVLVRITGREAAADDPDLLGLFPTPRQYVLQFRPEGADRLVVTLDGAAIEALLRRAGQPVWDSDRPLTMVWLAIEWGPGERELVAAAAEDSGRRARSIVDRSAEYREQVESAARRRGIPLQFPALDANERQQVTFSDVWGGFDDALIDASRGYGASSILVGRVRASEAFNHRWSYYFGRQRQSWTGTVEAAIDLLADALADQFAYAGNAPVESVTLTISGVDTIEAYGSVQRMMNDLGVIDSYRVDTVSGDQIRYVVAVPGGHDRLRNALEFSGVLEQPDWLGVDEYFGPSDEPRSLQYRYRAADRSPSDAVLPAPGNAGQTSPQPGVTNR